MKFKILQQFIDTLWDGDVTLEEVTGDHSEETLCYAEDLISDLGIALGELPFASDPAFDRIENHESYGSFKEVFSNPLLDLELR